MKEQNLPLKLAQEILDLSKKQNPPFIVGIRGAPGSGKSTLSQKIKKYLNEDLNTKTIVISLDDIYKTKREREEMAEKIHPLFKTRGVPGTHDVNLGIKILNDLRKADENTTTFIPTFNKLTDDRSPRENWQKIKGKPCIIIFEGWCVGIKAQKEEDLRIPSMNLEKKEHTQMNLAL